MDSDSHALEVEILAVGKGLYKIVTCDNGEAWGEGLSAVEVDAELDDWHREYGRDSADGYPHVVHDDRYVYAVLLRDSNVSENAIGPEKACIAERRQEDKSALRTLRERRRRFLIRNHGKELADKLMPAKKEE